MKNKTFYIAIAAIVAIFLIVMCVSCSVKKNQSPKNNGNVQTAMSKPFDAKAKMSINGVELTADINRTTPGQMTVAVTEPKVLSGMKFAYDGENIIVSYNNMSVKLDSNSTVASSAGKLLIDTINAAAKDKGVQVSMKNGAMSITGKGDSGNYIITVDKNNGSIISVAVPEAEFECLFSDFLFKNN